MLGSAGRYRPSPTRFMHSLTRVPCVHLLFVLLRSGRTQNFSWRQPKRSIAMGVPRENAEKVAKEGGRARPGAGPGAIFEAQVS